MNIAVINPQEFVARCTDGSKIGLIDVRTPVEFREVHVEVARNVPALGEYRHRMASAESAGHISAAHTFKSGTFHV